MTAARLFARRHERLPPSPSKSAAEPENAVAGAAAASRAPRYCARFKTDKRKSPDQLIRAFAIISLTMSYFHTGTRTIIGAKAFHCPVRDGKEWDHLAMVIRLNLSPHRPQGVTANS